MSEGKITRDKEAVAIDAINKAMATLDAEQEAAIVSWFRRKYDKPEKE